MNLDEKNLPDSDEIRRLEQEHRHYSEKLEALMQKPYLSEDDQIEEVRLKKLKLRIKDEIASRQSPAVHLRYA